MENQIRDEPRVVFTDPVLWFHILFDSVCRTKKTLNAHCTKHRTHSQYVSHPLLRSCFSLLCVCVFPQLRISQCHYETSSIVTSCQFSRNQKQATGVNTFLRFGSLAEGEQAQIAQGRSGDEKA